MSAVYKVMEQMQKTRQRRIRGNREVMIVLGAIIVVGMLMLVHGLNKRLKEDKQRAASSQHTKVITGTVGSGQALDGNAPGLMVSVNADGDWVVGGVGKVSEEELYQLLVEKRQLYHEQGEKAQLGVRIEAEQPAHYLKRIHQIAIECGMDKVLIGNWSQSPDKP